MHKEGYETHFKAKSGVKIAVKTALQPSLRAGFV